MADKKISALTASTTPLTGTEVLPIVQGGSTVKVAVSDLTAGRSVAASSITQNGKSTPYALLNNGIPMVLPSSGTIGNNGALSGITTIPAGIVYPHAYVYLPANAISAGSAAGYYYAQFSSATAATLYNNTYVSGSPSVPSSPTAFVTTGPGAYTQNTAAETAAISVPLAANIVGVSGSIDVNISMACTINANTKIVRVAIDSTGNQICGLSAISTGYIRFAPSLIAMGVTNRQMCVASMTTAQGGLGSSTLSPGLGTFLSLDMTATHNLIIYLRNLNAADTTVLTTAQADVRL